MAAIRSSRYKMLCESGYDHMYGDSRSSNQIAPDSALINRQIQTSRPVNVTMRA